MAADSGSWIGTFDAVVARARLIVVARIGAAADGGIVLDVERTLRGRSADRLVFPATDAAPPLETWHRAVVAFTDPTTIDFRAPTIAWHVAPDGTIDPEGFQPYVGLPPTLDAMLAAFGQAPLDPGASPAGAPAISPAPASPAPATGDDGAPVVPVAVGLGLGFAAVLGAGLVARRRRPAQ